MIRPKRRAFLLILGAGLLARLLGMGLPGTEDMSTNQLWGAWTVERGLTRAYVRDDAYYVERAVAGWRHLPVHAVPIRCSTSLGILDYVPNYPPIGIALFWMSAQGCAWIQAGPLSAGPLLNACFNLFPVLGALGTFLLLWQFLQEEEQGNALLASAVFWLNPVLIFHIPVLGGVDSLFAFFGLFSLFCLYRKKYTASLLFLAVSCLTKPQGVLIAPVVAAVILMENAWPRISVLATRFVLFCLLPLVPFALSGRALAALRGTFQVIDTGYLSWQQANVWWIASWLVPAMDGGNWHALLDAVRMQPYTRFDSLTGVDPRILALALLAVFEAFCVYYLVKELRRGNRWAIFWAAALNVYGFSMLSLYPHENHLHAFFVYVAPLLVLRGRFFPALYAAVSVVFALNLYLFDGFGRGLDAGAALVRSLPGFDLTVVLALANVLIFCWVVAARHWRFPLTAPGLTAAD